MNVSHSVFREAKARAEAALNNEQVTRVRVERLEGVVFRGFFGRLRWLIFGR